MAGCTPRAAPQTQRWLASTSCWQRRRSWPWRRRRTWLASGRSSRWAHRSSCAPTLRTMCCWTARAENLRTRCAQPASPPSCLRTARPTGAERAARAHRQSTAASAPPPASPRRCSAWRAAQAAAGKPESYEIFHIILWSSIGIALALFFAVLALVNMDVGNDSMLYSKARSPPGRCPLEASPHAAPCLSAAGRPPNWLPCAGEDRLRGAALSRLRRREAAAVTAQADSPMPRHSIAAVCRGAQNRSRTPSPGPAGVRLAPVAVRA